MNTLKINRFSLNRIQKALLIFIIFLEISFYANAQTDFAPINAKWYYSYYKDLENLKPVEYFTYESVKDTFVNGKYCRKLDIWYYTLQKDSVYWGFDLIYSDSGRVYYFYKNKFLLLYDFNVKVGDTLNLLLYNPNIPRIKDLPDTHYVKYRVRETGTIKINNEQLRYYDLNTIKLDTQIIRGKQLCFDDRIIEKLGDTNFIFGKIISWIDVYRLRSNLRCYSDNNFQYHAKKDIPCDIFYTTINKKNIQKSDIQLYPNPVNDIFTIKSSSNSTFTIEIYNTIGELIYFEDKIINTNTINLEGQKPGIYLLQISTLTSSCYYKIIKN
jgi:hypothetical protein